MKDIGFVALKIFKIKNVVNYGEKHMKITIKKILPLFNKLAIRNLVQHFPITHKELSVVIKV